VTQLYPQGLGSLLVASYDSQGYDGGIRPRIHTGWKENKGIGVVIRGSVLLREEVGCEKGTIIFVETVQYLDAG
jgi:hypothetical protein